MFARFFRLVSSLFRENVYKVVRRNKDWPTVRKEYLEYHPKCEACNSVNHLQVHHVVPFHEDPTKELDLNNLITLCMDVTECHLLIGHCGSFHYYNPNVKKDAKEALEHPDRMEVIKQTAVKNALRNDGVVEST